MDDALVVVYTRPPWLWELGALRAVGCDTLVRKLHTIKRGIATPSQHGMELNCIAGFALDELHDAKDRPARTGNHFTRREGAKKVPSLPTGTAYGGRVDVGTAIGIEGRNQYRSRRIQEESFHPYVSEMPLIMRLDIMRSAFHPPSPLDEDPANTRSRPRTHSPRGPLGPRYA